MPTQKPLPSLVITPAQGTSRYWLDLWRYRELLGFLAWRDLKVRYKQAVLGVAWAILQPAVQVVLLTFVFGKLAQMPAGDEQLPYPLLVLAGLLPWQLFSNAFSGAGGSLVGNSHLISKVYFPRLIVPLSSLAVAVVDFLILLVLTLLILPIAGYWPTWHLVLLPLFLLAALLIAFGAGLWITALTVRFRDFRFISPFILQVGLFVTPVGYRTDNLPTWRELLALNPLTGVIDGFRWCLLGGKVEFQATALISTVVVSGILLGTGLWLFRRTERSFADII
ncbi:MAG: ABC transporter permease [Opitutaceae bacterium]|nr:ABC transporter permease [Opitutaceae bacterium]